MRFVRQYKFILLFFLLLVFCSAMWVRQKDAKQKKHVEMREAFILLYTRNYTNEARQLYRKLLDDVPKYADRISDKQLLDDFQRTLMLIDPDWRTQQTNNLIWNYHWVVSEELDKRSVDLLARAHKLAREAAPPAAKP
jgi:hypothetical protein